MQPCPDHKRKAWSDKKTSASSRGYGARWRRLRTMILARDPLCACGAPSTEVDHIIGKAKGGTDALDNLQGICEPCHKAKTESDKRSSV